MNREKFAEGRSLLPSDSAESVIEGGNHVQFGVYGKQKGDNDASVSAEEQRSITCEAVVEWLNNNLS